MKAGIISFTENGAVLARKLKKELGARDMVCGAWLKKSGDRPPEGVEPLNGSLG